MLALHLGSRPRQKTERLYLARILAQPEGIQMNHAIVATFQATCIQWMNSSKPEARIQ